MSNHLAKKLDKEFFEMTPEEHLSLLEQLSEDDLDYVDEVMDIDNIEELKQAVLSIHMSNMEYRIRDYVNMMINEVEPHSKDIDMKMHKLIKEMTDLYFKNQGIDNNDK